MSAAEFGLQWEDYRRQPWGDFRVDLVGGMIASTLANIHRDTKKRQQPYTASDFMPFLHEPEPPAAPPDPVEFFSTLGEAPK